MTKALSDVAAEARRVVEAELDKEIEVMRQRWRAVLGLPPATAKAFDESKIRRWPAGTPVDPATGAGGGRFAPKEAGERSADSGERGEGGESRLAEEDRQVVAGLRRLVDYLTEQREEQRAAVEAAPMGLAAAGERHKLRQIDRWIGLAQAAIAQIEAGEQVEPDTLESLFDLLEKRFTAPNAPYQRRGKTLAKKLNGIWAKYKEEYTRLNDRERELVEAWKQAQAGKPALTDEALAQLEREIADNHGRILAMEAEMRKAVVPLLKAQTPMAITYIPLKYAGELGDHLDTAVKAVSEYVEQSVWPDSAQTRLSYTIGAARSNYNLDGNFLHLDPNEKARGIVHEIGHWLEANAPGLLDKTVAFLKRRTGDERPQRLNQITPYNYDDDEIAQPDRFRHPYIGKVYTEDGSDRRVATEVLSMGLEMLATEPLQFAEEDPEMFAFIVDILRGYA